MRSILSVSDAIATLSRSSLPTVITEGLTDYTAMRRIEENLADLGVDFLPLGGKSMVLEVWNGLDSTRKLNTVALVDLDAWLYYGVPDEYRSDRIITTHGYSIENDIALDFNFEKFFEGTELVDFINDLKIICSLHARAIEHGRLTSSCDISHHSSKIIANDNVHYVPHKDVMSLSIALFSFYRQCVRGHTIMQLYVKRLSHRAKGRAKFGYHHLLEIGTLELGAHLKNLEAKIRQAFS